MRLLAATSFSSPRRNRPYLTNCKRTWADVGSAKWMWPFKARLRTYFLTRKRREEPGSARCRSHLHLSAVPQRPKQRRGSRTVERQGAARGRHAPERGVWFLDRLDGITFAVNVQAALDDLDRGFDVNATSEGTPEYIAQGIATALVLRDGVLKVRIVLDALDTAKHFSVNGCRTPQRRSILSLQALRRPTPLAGSTKHFRLPAGASYDE